MRPPAPALADVERALHRLFIDAEGTTLRREDVKKTVEVTALLGELARLSREGPLLDLAAGKSYLGLLAVELLGFERVVVLEREARHLESCRRASAHLTRPVHLELHEGDVGDVRLWPSAPAVVTALHACGPATDAVIDATVRSPARWLLLVPCCYGATVPFWEIAHAHARRLGIPRHAEVEKRFVHSLIDAERTLRLEAAGWETTVVPFVAPTVTPHNLLFRARRLMEPKRMADAAGRLEGLRAVG